MQRHWKALDPDRTHGGSEHYLRRHWFELLIDDGNLSTGIFRKANNQASYIMEL